MFMRLKTELVDLYAFLKRNYNEVIVISLSTLFLMLAKYHSFGSVWQDYLFYYGVLPILTILILLRKNPVSYGLKLGDWKLWLFHLCIALPVIFLLVYWGTRTSAVHRYYDSIHFKPVPFMLNAALGLLAWEFFFRGFMLFGLREKYKEGAILIQMIPFAIMHIRKPEVETISCIVSGIYFGYLCYKTKSFWPAYIIHVFINYSTKFLSVY